MITEKEDACWHCDQWVYTLIFWNKSTIGENARVTTNYHFLNKLIKNVTKINPEHMRMIASRAASLSSRDAFGSSHHDSKEELKPQIEFDYHQSALDAPFIYGEFTNWKPLKMVAVGQFVMELNRKYGKNAGPNFE